MKDVFKKYNLSAGNTSINKKKEFLRIFPMFSFLPEDKVNIILTECATKCENKKYPGNTIISR